MNNRGTKKKEKTCQPQEEKALMEKKKEGKKEESFFSLTPFKENVERKHVNQFLRVIKGFK